MQKCNYCGYEYSENRVKCPECKNKRNGDDMILYCVARKKCRDDTIQLIYSIHLTKELAEEGLKKVGTAYYEVIEYKIQKEGDSQ